VAAQKSFPLAAAQQTQAVRTVRDLSDESFGERTAHTFVKPVLRWGLARHLINTIASFSCDYRCSNRKQRVLPEPAAKPTWCAPRPARANHAEGLSPASSQRA